MNWFTLISTRLTTLVRPRKPRVVSFLLRFTAANILLSFFIGIRVFVPFFERMDLSEFLFVCTALLGSTTVNFLVFLFLFYLIINRFKHIRRVFFVTILVYGLLQWFFFIDSMLFEKLNVHAYAAMGYGVGFLIDGFIGIGSTLVWPTLIAGALLMPAMYYIARQVMPYMGKSTFWRREVSSRFRWAVWAVALGVILLELGLFALAMHDNNRSLKRYANAIPLYPNQTIGYLLVGSANDKPSAENTELNYPIKRIGGRAERNLLWITLEGFGVAERRKGYCPLIEQVADTMFDFTNCYTISSNYSEQLFANYYGLLPSYYPAFVRQISSPALFSTLLDRNYELRAFLPHKAQNSEIRRLLFIEHANELVSKTKREANQEVVHSLTAWLATRETGKAFAAFVHLDAAKYPYVFDSARASYRPYRMHANLLQTSQFDDSLYNAYLNALNFQEQLLAQILQAVRNTPAVQNTVVLISSDAKDLLIQPWEDADANRYRQLFLLWAPNQKPGQSKAPLQSVDILPTVVKAMGLEAHEPDYCNGFEASTSQKRAFLLLWQNDSATFRASHDMGKPYSPNAKEQSWLSLQTQRFLSPTHRP